MTPVTPIRTRPIDQVIVHTNKARLAVCFRKSLKKSGLKQVLREEALQRFLSRYPLNSLRTCYTFALLNTGVLSWDRLDMYLEFLELVKEDDLCNL